MDRFIVSDILALAMAQATPKEAGRLALVNREMAARFRLAVPVCREGVVHDFLSAVRAFFAAPEKTREHLNVEVKVLQGAKIAWTLTLTSHSCTIYRGGSTMEYRVVARYNAVGAAPGATTQFARALVTELEAPFKEIRSRVSFRGCPPVIKACGEFLAYLEASKTPTVSRRRRQM